ncbi:hypothetical protein BKA69DRAFT_1112327 [Paraphysoderma sedebokerense]|nr:hypothetical protein BKA69DRAFT_1112327 [Paraphysoderma sedebokerense]
MANPIPKINFKSQSVELPGTRKPGQTGIYRNSLSPKELVSLHPLKKDVKTLYNNFQSAAKQFPNNPCLGHRSFNPTTKKWSGYQWQTYGQVAERSTDFGSGLLSLYDRHILSDSSSATVPKEKWHLGLFSINRPEWAIAEQSCNDYSLVTVALYDTLGADTIEFVINHGQLPIVVTSADKIATLLKVKSNCPSPNLKIIISMDELEFDQAKAPVPGVAATPSATPVNQLQSSAALLNQWAQEKGVILLTFRQVEELGRKNRIPHKPPTPADLATICYTSGTTGEPKGAMLTHENIMANSACFYYYGLELTENDVHISYLPLAHIFERAVMTSILSNGGAVGFYRGDVLVLIEDIACLRPTVFPSVPRLFNRIYGKLLASTVQRPGPVGFLFRKAVAEKKARLDAGEGFDHALWDKTIFSKVRAVLGGRVRLMITGSAPLQKEVMQFLRIAFSCVFIEGYGQTENAACATIQIPGETTAGHVGPPQPCNEIKLVDVPEMNYQSTDKPFPRGEVCIRGPNVFRGYWKDSAKTKETIDEEGWLHTGDIGLMNERGQLQIIDRKKNIFKLAQGEYIAPEKIENVYLQCPLLMQVFVHGDSLQSELVGVVVPNPDNFVPWLKSIGFAGPFEEACKDANVKSKLHHEMDKVGKKLKLRGFEFVKLIHIEPNPFTVDNGLITPTFKLKRPQALQRYRKEIDAMYKLLETTKADSGNGTVGSAKL